MSGIAPFYMIVHMVGLLSAHGHSMATVPMATQAACNHAATHIAANPPPRGYRVTRVWCVPSGAPVSGSGGQSNG